MSKSLDQIWFWKKHSDYFFTGVYLVVFSRAFIYKTDASYGRNPHYKTKTDSLYQLDGVFLVNSEEARDLLQWRHNERDGVSNHRRLDYSLNRLFRHR